MKDWVSSATFLFLLVVLFVGRVSADTSDSESDEPSALFVAHQSAQRIQQTNLIGENFEEAWELAHAPVAAVRNLGFQAFLAYEQKWDLNDQMFQTLVDLVEERRMTTEDVDLYGVLRLAAHLQTAHPRGSEIEDARVSELKALREIDQNEYLIVSGRFVPDFFSNAAREILQNHANYFFDWLKEDLGGLTVDPLLLDVFQDLPNGAVEPLEALVLKRVGELKGVTLAYSPQVSVYLMSLAGPVVQEHIQGLQTLPSRSEIEWLAKNDLDFSRQILTVSKEQWSERLLESERPQMNGFGMRWQRLEASTQDFLRATFSKVFESALDPNLPLKERLVFIERMQKQRGAFVFAEEKGRRALRAFLPYLLVHEGESNINRAFRGYSRRTEVFSGFAESFDRIQGEFRFVFAHFKPALNAPERLKEWSPELLQRRDYERWLELLDRITQSYADSIVESADQRASIPIAAAMALLRKDADLQKVQEEDPMTLSLSSAFGFDLQRFFSELITHRVDLKTYDDFLAALGPQSEWAVEIMFEHKEFTPRAGEVFRRVLNERFHPRSSELSGKILDWGENAVEVIGDYAGARLVPRKDRRETLTNWVADVGLDFVKEQLSPEVTARVVSLIVQGLAPYESVVAFELLASIPRDENKLRELEPSALANLLVYFSSHFEKLNRIERAQLKEKADFIFEVYPPHRPTDEALLRVYRRFSSTDDDRDCEAIEAKIDELEEAFQSHL